MLNVSDRLEIQELYARYAWAVDTGDVDTWVGLFTPDGRFEAARDYQGCEELRGFIVAYCAAAVAGDLYDEQHWNNALVLDEGPDHVRGRCYLMRVARAREDDEVRLLRQASYQDEIVKIDGRWRFRRRRVHFVMPTSPTPAGPAADTGSVPR